MTVTVLIPVRNGAATVRSAVASVLTSSNGSVTACIVVDDHSDDGLEVALKPLSGDPRLRIVRNAGRGLAAALNTGLDAIETDFVARLDADDEALPARFDAQLRYLQCHPEVALVGGQMVRVNAQGREVSTSRLPTGHAAIVRSLERGFHALAHSSVMFRASEVRYIDRPAEDYAFFFDQAARGELHNLETPVIRYRYHDASVTSTSMLRHRSDLVELLHERGIVNGPGWARGLRARRESLALSLYKSEVGSVERNRASAAARLAAAVVLYPEAAAERLRRSR